MSLIENSHSSVPGATGSVRFPSFVVTILPALQEPNLAHEHGA